MGAALTPSAKHASGLVCGARSTERKWGVCLTRRLACTSKTLMQRAAADPGPDYALFHLPALAQKPQGEVAVYSLVVSLIRLQSPA